MKTMTFALALATLTVMTTASAQLAQVRSERAGEMSAPLAFVIDESDLRSMSIQVADAAPNGGSPALSARGSGGSAGKASFKEFRVSKQYDKASPMLAKRVANGTHFPTVIITVRKSGGKPEEYYTIKMTDVMVSSYQTGMSSGGDRPMESLSLNFTKIEWDYRSSKDR